MINIINTYTYIYIYLYPTYIIYPSNTLYPSLITLSQAWRIYKTSKSGWGRFVLYTFLYKWQSWTTLNVFFYLKGHYLLKGGKSSYSSTKILSGWCHKKIIILKVTRWSNAMFRNVERKYISWLGKQTGSWKWKTTDFYLTTLTFRLATRK